MNVADNIVFFLYVDIDTNSFNWMYIIHSDIWINLEKKKTS